MRVEIATEIAWTWNCKRFGNLERLGINSNDSGFAALSGLPFLADVTNSCWRIVPCHLLLIMLRHCMQSEKVANIENLENALTYSSSVLTKWPFLWTQLSSRFNFICVPFSDIGRNCEPRRTDKRKYRVTWTSWEPKSRMGAWAPPLWGSLNGGSQTNFQRNSREIGPGKLGFFGVDWGLSRAYSGAFQGWLGPISPLLTAMEEQKLPWKGLF